jgi:hypothetical protein
MEEKVPPVFIVNGKEYPVPSEFTLGEMCDAEQYFGVEFGAETGTGMRFAAAALYIAIRRVDPTVTVEDIRALPPEVFATAAGDASPPETPEPAGSSNESSDSSGESSSNGGGDLVDVPVPTGPQP